MESAGPFRISPQQLAELNEDGQSFARLKAVGNVEGLLEALNTDAERGLPGDERDLAIRRETFGVNEIPQPEQETWLELFLGAFNDPTLIVLMISATVSLLIGLYDDPVHGWIEGAAILLAVMIVAVVTATNDYNKEKQFRKLNAVRDSGDIPVVRNGEIVPVPISKLVVGDIVVLNAGDKIPADGIMVTGSDVSCVEAALTGEAEDKPKSSEDPFLLSGCTMSTGACRMVVVAVGPNSLWGKIKAKLSIKQEDTPLQEKLNNMAELIGYIGMSAAAATFIAMMVGYFLESHHEVPLLQFALRAFIMAVTIVVVAVPEGLPLAVTLSLAFSTQKMMKDNNLIRVLEACETMGNATNICSDKTGTLTQNKMTVVKAWLGGQFYEELPSEQQVGQSLLEMVCEGIAVNTTANLVHTPNGRTQVVGNQTEGALLSLIRDQFGADYRSLRHHGFDPVRGDKMLTFTSARKRMSVMQQRAHGYRLFCKGASEIILERCVAYTTSSGMESTLSDSERLRLEDLIREMGQEALRVVCIAHRDISTRQVDVGNASADELETDLVLDGLFGIKDPLRPDVPEAVRICQQAGIFVRMVTGDNIETAKAIARECGILTEGGIALEGPEFRTKTPAELDALLPRLQVLARSSPDDKTILVTRLNGHALPTDEDSWYQLHPYHNYEQDRDRLLPGYAEEWALSRSGVGEVVGVTGDGTNDGPALRAANVGLSMGLTGTDVAKDASDIVILDDNFSSIVKAVLWGRSVFDNIRKFLQFQLTVNIVALTITFLSAVKGYDPPLNAVMMLWVNLIMDTMGALALGTELPLPTLLQRRPYRRNAPLVNTVMWRNILVQATFQVALLLYLLTAGVAEFGVENGSAKHFTIIFNAFVFCQLFNEFNARHIGNDLNVFSGLHRNIVFLCIIAFTVAMQWFLVQHGGEFTRTVPLTRLEWTKTVLLGALSLPLGALSLPLGAFMRLLPVAEREEDFAPLPALAPRRPAQDVSKSSLAQVSGSHAFLASALNAIEEGLSFLVWAVVSVLVPVFVCVLFRSTLELYLPSLLGFVDVNAAVAHPLFALLGLELSD